MRNLRVKRYSFAIHCCTLLTLCVLAGPLVAMGEEPPARAGDGAPSSRNEIRSLVDQSVDRLLAGGKSGVERLVLGGKKATVAVVMRTGRASPERKSQRAISLEISEAIHEAKLKVAQAGARETQPDATPPDPSKSKKSARVLAVSVIRVTVGANGDVLSVAILAWDGGARAQLAAGGAMRFQTWDEASHALIAGLGSGAIPPFEGELLQLDDGSAHIIGFGSEGDPRGEMQALASLGAYQSGEEVEWSNESVGASTSSSSSSKSARFTIEPRPPFLKGSVSKETATRSGWTNFVAIAQDFNPSVPPKELPDPPAGKPVSPPQK